VSAPLLALALALAAAAEAPDPPAPAEPAAEVAGAAASEVAAAAPARPAPRAWFLFPAIYWLPETKAGLAVAGGRDFRLDGSTRSSNALLVAAYSIEGQGSVDGSADVWLRGGSLLSARARAVNYPDQFYGIGPHAPTAGREDFTRRFVEGSLSAELATLGGRLRGGPRLAFRDESIGDVEPGGRLATSGLVRIHGWSGLGAGGSLTWDTRDHPLWPLHGTFAQAYYLRYLAEVGANEGFGKGAVDLRRFQSVGGGRVLAFGAVLETTDGQTPFSLLSKLGNVRFLRGYREGRYRDRMVWATQVELRAPVRGPLSAVLFGGAGDVFGDLGSFTLEHPKLAAGAGARWRLTPGGANLRVDVAVGTAGPEVYVVLLEAF
jgi:hypothetical protein